MDVQVASDIRFGCFIYAQKNNEITFLMQPVSCQNLSEINGNHQNNILTVATGNDDVSNARGYCGWLLWDRWFSTTSLSKVGTDKLKN
jgi:hypothetical protein